MPDLNPHEQARPFFAIGPAICVVAASQSQVRMHAWARGRVGVLLLRPIQARNACKHACLLRVWAPLFNKGGGVPV